MASKAQTGEILQELLADVRIPDGLVADLADEQLGGATEFMKQVWSLTFDCTTSRKGARIKITKWKGKLGSSRLDGNPG